MLELLKVEDSVIQQHQIVVTRVLITLVNKTMFPKCQAANPHEQFLIGTYC